MPDERSNDTADRVEGLGLLIYRARSDLQIDACFAVISELRPHLLQSEFTETVRWMMDYDNYHLVYGVFDGTIACAAGYRLCTGLAAGPYMYVDDLVTSSAYRSRGFGKALLDWLKREAAGQLCDQLHLDSGVHRADAHRFYEREGLMEVARHFVTLIDRDG